MGFEYTCSCIRMGTLGFRANMNYDIARKLVIDMNSITNYIDESGILITSDIIKSGITKTQLYVLVLD